MENKNFCYWQEDPPIVNLIYNNKLCLLKENEYNLIKELKQTNLINKKINIFCPYINSVQAMECEHYKLIKEIKWEKF